MAPITAALDTAVSGALAEAAGLLAIAGDLANATNSPHLTELLRRFNGVQTAMREDRLTGEERAPVDITSIVELARRLRTLPSAPRERPPEAAEMRASHLLAGPISSTAL